jgi:hypothetical protein
MVEPVPLKSRKDRVDDDAHDERAVDFAATIRVLFKELSLADQEKVHSQLTEILRPIPAPRAGDVLGAVIHLFPKKAEWTVQELLAQLEAYGVAHTAKEVYNALGYLTRKQKIQRTGHGRYSIGGVSVVTSDELVEGPPSRFEEHDPN